MDKEPKYTLRQLTFLVGNRSLEVLRINILKILVFGLESPSGRSILSGAFRFDRVNKGGEFWFCIAYPETKCPSEEHLEEAKLELLDILQSIDALKATGEIKDD